MLRSPASNPVSQIGTTRIEISQDSHRPGQQRHRHLRTASVFFFEEYIAGIPAPDLDREYPDILW